MNCVHTVHAYNIYTLHAHIREMDKHFNALSVGYYNKQHIYKLYFTLVTNQYCEYNIFALPALKS